jgi:hypothetical protein
MSPIHIILVIIIIFVIYKLIKRSGSPKKGKYSTKGVVRQYNASTETILKRTSIIRAPNTPMKESVTKQVWRFLLERFDDAGNQLPFIAVEMKGTVLSGYIAEGNHVEIYDKIVPGETVTPRIMYNHTANAYIKVVRA